MYKILTVVSLVAVVMLVSMMFNVCFPCTVFFSTQWTGVTVAVVLREFWTRMNVIRTPVSASVYRDILVYSVRTVRMDSSPMVPAAVCLVPAIRLEQ